MIKISKKLKLCSPVKLLKQRSDLKNIFTPIQILLWILKNNFCLAEIQIKVFLVQRWALAFALKERC